MTINRVYIFDIDDTLINTKACVKMMEIVGKCPPAYKTYIRVWEDNEECRTNMKLQETLDLNITIMDIGDE